MPVAKLAACCGVAAICLSACGGSRNNPTAGTIAPGATQIGHAKLDDPRSKRLACMLQHHLPVTQFGRGGIQIGTAPQGPTVVFTPTAGAAQAQQIEGQSGAAEVIGAALVYPNQAPDSMLQVVEDCVGLQVKG